MSELKGTVRGSRTLLGQRLGGIASSALQASNEEARPGGGARKYTARLVKIKYKEVEGEREYYPIGYVELIEGDSTLKEHPWPLDIDHSALEIALYCGGLAQLEIVRPIVEVTFTSITKRSGKIKLITRDKSIEDYNNAEPLERDGVLLA